MGLQRFVNRGDQTKLRRRTRSKSFFWSDPRMISTRPPQDVNVLAALDFRIPCHHPETSGFIPDFCPPSIKTMDKNLDVRDDCQGENEELKVHDGEDVDALRSPDFDNHRIRSINRPTECIVCESHCFCYFKLSILEIHQIIRRISKRNSCQSRINLNSVFSEVNKCMFLKVSCFGHEI